MGKMVVKVDTADTTEARGTKAKSTNVQNGNEERFSHETAAILNYSKKLAAAPRAMVDGGQAKSKERNNCAIVGGIVRLYTGVEGISTAWRQAREMLPDWPFMDC